MTGTWFEPADLTAAVRAATGVASAEVAEWTSTAATHPAMNMTTARLDHVRGTTTDGDPFAVFVKTLQPASASPIWQSIPEAFHDEVLLDLDWLDEPRAYRSAFVADMPDGVRVPHVWHTVEQAEEIQLWLESVADHGGWDVAHYHDAAVALGRLAGRWPAQRVVALGLKRRSIAVRWFGKVLHGDLPRLADEATWSHPALAADPALRADLERLLPFVPGLLQRETELPHALCHGDACPANLLGGPDGFVAVDLSYVSNGAIGSDLAQLLAGRFMDGTDDPSRLGELADEIHDGFATGLAREDAAVDHAAIELAFITHLIARTTCDALAADHDAAPELAVGRIALARFTIDRALRLPVQAGLA